MTQDPATIRTVIALARMLEISPTELAEWWRETDRNVEYYRIFLEALYGKKEDEQHTS